MNEEARRVLHQALETIERVDDAQAAWAAEQEHRRLFEDDGAWDPTNPKGLTVQTMSDAERRSWILAGQPPLQPQREERAPQEQEQSDPQIYREIPPRIICRDAAQSELVDEQRLEEVIGHVAEELTRLNEAVERLRRDLDALAPVDIPRFLER